MKQWAALIFAVVLAVALTWFGTDYASLKRASAQNENRGRVLQTTSNEIDAGQKADAVRDEINTGVSVGREVFNNDYQEAIRHEPQVAIRADRPVPDSVRAAARKRRLARERLGCVPGECEARREDSDPAER